MTDWFPDAVVVIREKSPHDKKFEIELHNLTKKVIETVKKSNKRQLDLLFTS